MEMSRIIQLIQQVLAPVVMVSSTALLLLGLQNKFSNLASRFRVLNHEKRLLLAKTSRETLEENRFHNLVAQVDHLMKRARYVKNAIVLSYLGIVFFTGTSVLIFLSAFASFMPQLLTIGIFMMGLLCIFIASILMILEVNLFHKIISLESES